jgi:alpha-mannosidase
MLNKLLRKIKLKKPVIINCKNYVLIWKDRKNNCKVYGNNPAAVDQWYRILAEDLKK